MKTIYIPLSSKFDLEKSKIDSIPKKLPKNISLFYSIQYNNIALKLKKELSKKHNILNFSQILGCSNPKISEKSKAVLIISDGTFHSLSSILNTKIPIYLLARTSIRRISNEEKDSINKNKKISYINYLNADNIGILISLKKGQQRLKSTLNNLKKLDKNKKYYLFIGDNLNLAESENFPEIKAWINTACPRLDYNNRKIINISDLLNSG